QVGAAAPTLKTPSNDKERKSLPPLPAKLRKVTPPPPAAVPSRIAPPPAPRTAPSAKVKPAAVPKTTSKPKADEETSNIAAAGADTADPDAPRETPLAMPGLKPTSK